MSGPAFSSGEVISIAAFAANFAIVAPASAICLAVAIATRKMRRPLWLLPVAFINLGVVMPQLLLGSDLEWWLAGLLLFQLAVALVVLDWVLRRTRPAPPR